MGYYCETCDIEIQPDMNHRICNDCLYDRVKPKEQKISFTVKNKDDQTALLQVLSMNGYKTWCETNTIVNMFSGDDDIIIYVVNTIVT